MKNISRRMFIGSGITFAAATYFVKRSLPKIFEFDQPIFSGFVELDILTGGFFPGDLIVLGARPSMGKTAFSLNQVLNVSSLKDKKTVAYFSLDIPIEQVIIRLLSMSSGISFTELKSPSQITWLNLIGNAKESSAKQIYIDDTFGLKPSELHSKCQKLKSNGKLDLVIVDYLQLMALEGKNVNRQQEVAEITRQLKSIAMDLKVPMIVLAQLNRGLESRSDRRPLLADIRESGAVEQIADVVMLLYREDYYYRDDESVRGLTEVVVAKNRSGPTGVARLKFVRSCGRFENISV